MPEPGVAPARAAKPTSPPRRPQRLEGPETVDWEAGETDLHEALMPRGSLSMLVIGLVVLAVIAVTGLLILPRLMAPDITPTAAGSTETTDATAVAVQSTAATAITRLAPPPTNTRLAILPTLDLATVTPQPPTQTLTPTRGPCIQKARAGDTLYGLASRCGHRDKAVIDEILRINNMTSATDLQVNQEVEIPWPTPTGGAPLPAATGDSTNQPDQSLEATLPPGVMWYTVKKGENALIIAFSHGIPLRILRDLNPEIPFDGCDFGQNGGGPTCNVIIYEGQRLRVPAPTPTPTIQPTPNGSETPTPTATPTYNAPFSQLPSDNMLFESYEFPTLRWTTTGQLKLDEVFLVTVVDRTANITHQTTTRELSFQLPPDWQPTDGKKHVFAWSITIATLQGEKAIPSSYVTETRTFTWPSR